MLQNINKLWTWEISFHKTLHLYKITFSAEEEKQAKTHPHILPQTSHVCTNHIYFCHYAISKVKGRNSNQERRKYTKYFGLNSSVPWHHILARTIPGQGTHSCWAKCQHKSERIGASIYAWFSHGQLTWIAWKQIHSKTPSFMQLLWVLMEMRA